MSRPRKEAAALVGPDGASPSGPIEISGITKTSLGYAVVRAVLKPDGSVESVSMTASQAFKEHVASQHKRIALAEALKA